MMCQFKNINLRLSGDLMCPLLLLYQCRRLPLFVGYNTATVDDYSTLV